LNSELVYRRDYICFNWITGYPVEADVVSSIDKF